MRRTKILICTAGVLLCYLWFNLITPRLHSDGHNWYVLNWKVLLVCAVGWAVITAICVFAYAKVGKKAP